MQNLDNFEDKNSWLSIGDASGFLRISRDTLRRWEKKGILRSYRSPTFHRYYKKEDLERVFSAKPDIADKPFQAQAIEPGSIQAINRLDTLLIFLLTLYVVLTIFLIWLLLRNI